MAARESADECPLTSPEFFIAGTPMFLRIGGRAAVRSAILAASLSLGLRAAEPPADPQAGQIAALEREIAAGTAARAAGQLPEAVAHFRRASDLEKQLGSDLQPQWRWWLLTVRAEVDAGAFDAAEARLTDLADRRAARLGRDHWSVRETRRVLGDVRTVRAWDADKRRGLAEAGRADAAFRKAYDAGEDARAVPKAAEAMAILKSVWGGDHADYGLAAYNFALVADGHSDRGASAAAAEAVLAEKLGTDHLIYARCLRLRGQMASRAGDPAGAVRKLTAAVAAFEAALGKESSETIIAMRSLGFAYLHAGQTPDALATLGAAHTLAQASAGPRSALAADSAEQLATAFSSRAARTGSRADHRAAADYLEKTVDIRKSLTGPASVGYAWAVAQLANSYQQLGRLEEAEARSREALAVLRPRRDAAAGQFDVALSGLAQTVYLRGRSAAARELWTELDSFRKAIHGPRARERILGLKVIANLSMDLFEFAAAEAALTEIAAIGTGNPEAAGDVAEARLRIAGIRRGTDLPAAIGLFRRAVELHVATFGAGAPETLRARNQLGKALVESGDLAAAEQIANEVMQIATAAKPPDRFSAADAHDLLAAVAEARSDRGRMKAELLQSLDIYRDLWGETDRRYLTHRNAAAVRLHAVGDSETAEKWLRELLAAGESLKDDLFVAGVAGALGGLLSGSAGRYAEAERLYLRARQTYEAAGATGGENYAHLLALLAGVAQKTSGMEKATELYGQAIAAHRRIGRPSRFFQGDLRLYGIALQEVGRLDEAGRAFAEAETLTVQIYGADSVAHADVLERLSRWASARADPAACRKHILRAVAIYEAKAPDSMKVADGLQSLATACYTEARFEEAARHLDRACTIVSQRVGENSAAYADLMHDLARVYAGQTRYKEARPFAERAVALRGGVPGVWKFQRAGSLIQLGKIRIDLGDARGGLPLVREAADLLREEPSGEQRLSYASALADLGFTELMLQDRAGAERDFRRAERVAAEYAGQFNPIRQTARRGLVLVCLNDDRRIGEGRRLLESVIAETRRHGASLESFMDQALLTGLAHGEKDFAAAEAAARATAALAEKLNLAGTYRAEGQGLLAHVFERRGDWAAAEEHFRLAADGIKASLGENSLRYSSYLAAIGRVRLGRGDRPAAAAELSKALDLQRRQQDDTFAALSERQQLELAAGAREALDLYLSATDDSAAESAYAHVLAWKGAVFEQQGRLAALRKDGTVAPLLADWEREAREWAALAYRAPAGLTAEELATRRGAAFERKEQAEQRLATHSRAFAEGRTPVGLDKLRDVLPPDTALVDFWEYTRQAPPAAGGADWQTERRLIAFVVRRGVPVRRLDLGNVNTLRQALSQWAPQSFARMTADREAGAAALRQLLWQPLERELNGATNVLVAPDGITARVPFAALPGKSSRFLIEEVAIGTVPVPRLVPRWLANPPAPAANESLLLVGGVDFGPAPPAAPPATVWPPLPGTVAEVDRLSRLWRDRHKTAPAVLAAAAATKSAVRDQAPRAGWVHLATHGFFLDDTTAASPRGVAGRLAALGPEATPLGAAPPVFNPGLASGVVLAGANAAPADGWWTAAEVATLDWSAVRLVTLSACDTGLGRDVPGEGVLGIQRAFLVGGARAVLTSLWKVEDAATAALMAEVCDRMWAAGPSPAGPARGLRAAQLEMIRGYDRATGTVKSRGLEKVVIAGVPAGTYLPPAYWAAFVCSGDWR